MSINGNLFIPGDREPCNVPIGENEILVRDANGCEVTYIFEVFPPDEYEIDLGDDLVVPNPATETIGYFSNLPEDSITQRIWTVNDSIFCEGCDSILLDVESNLLVGIKAYYAGGECYIEDVLHIVYSDELSIFIPNIFSPNGDGRNDYFTVYGDEKVRSIVSLQIFDRWGTFIWEGRSLTPGNEPQGWNGAYKGEIVQPGVYVYSVELELDNGSMKRLQGTITVQR
jgi:gliding motility-associated-like protein